VAAFIAATPASVSAFAAKVSKLCGSIHDSKPAASSDCKIALNTVIDVASDVSVVAGGLGATSITAAEAAIEAAKEEPREEEVEPSKRLESLRGSAINGSYERVGESRKGA
jgi:hypothetical protein